MVDHLMKAFIKESHGQSAQMRVWKGIYRIWDLIKIWCRNRENHEYLRGIRDFTAFWEAGLAKIWIRDAGFLSPVCREFGKLSRPKLV